MSSFTAGQSLCDLAVDQSGTHLYVTDDGPERLLVIDPATQQQSAQYALTDSLCSIALDEGGDTAYVPTWKRGAQGGFVSSRIQAINLATGLITSLRADQFPTGPFFDARQRLLYAGDTAEPTLAIVGLGGVSDTLALPAKVNRVAVSPANGSLYLASPDANRVFVVDPVRRDVVATLSVGERPWGAVAEPQSGHVFVSLELSGAVAVVDPATETVLRTTTTGSHPRNLAVDPVHHRVYVLNAGSRTVAALDANGDLVATSPPLGGAEDLTGLAVAPQTGVVYVVSKTHIVALR